MPGTLYIVATPIGNLEDITLRALRVLKEADLIAAEDTRQTKKLVARYDIATPLTSYYDAVEGEKAAQLAKQLERGKNIALVSDAGTPTLSDPGFRLIQAAITAGASVVPVPGPSALLAVLSASGLPTDRFVFEGFLPGKRHERREKLRTLAAETRTLVFYEAPHRIRPFLREAFGALPGRECVVGREITKRFESIGPVTDPEQVPERGEFVVLFGPPPAQPAEAMTPEAARARVASLVESGVEEKEALRQVARDMGVPRREIYAIVKGKNA